MKTEYMSKEITDNLDQKDKQIKYFLCGIAYFILPPLLSRFIKQLSFDRYAAKSITLQISIL